MATQLKLGDIRATVVRKPIRNIHLSVHPPTGRVTIAAPDWVTADSIRLFAINKLAWIRRQQRKQREQEREPLSEYIERESHYVWGRRYLLRVVETDAPPAVELRHNKLMLQVRPGADWSKRHAVMEDWYRTLLRDAVHSLLTKWEPIVGRKVEHVFIQRMKTKWGGCNHVRRNIRLNTDLARKPRECLEYVLVHELVHLREPTHNQRFMQLMHEAMPNWLHCRDELNRLPLRQEM
jgi:predicted metal-dependent hydrolase